MSEDRETIENTARGSGRRWLVAVILAVTLLAAGVIAAARLQTPRYFAKATIKVKEPEYSSRCFPHQPDYAFAESQIRLLDQTEVLYPVIQKLDLGRILKKGAEPVSTETAYSFLKGSLAIRRVPNTDVIEIGAYSKDSVLAVTIANTIADVYRDKWMGLIMRDRERAIGDLEKEVEKRRNSVDQAAGEATRIKEQEGVLDPDLNYFGAPVSAPNGKGSASAYIDAKSRYLQQLKLLEIAQRNVQEVRMAVPPDIVEILEKAEPPTEPVRFWFPRIR